MDFRQLCSRLNKKYVARSEIKVLHCQGQCTICQVQEDSPEAEAS